MGLLSDLFRPTPIVEQKAMAVAATVTPYDTTAQHNYLTYDRGAREGYLLDELVYQCVQERMKAAGEPPLCAWRRTRTDEEKLTDPTDAPGLALLNRPNPFMSRSAFWQTLLMHLDIGGNAYIEKVRSGAGKVVELWLLRPDRMKVIPDPQRFIGGYTYTVGPDTRQLAPQDVIHFKTPNPLDDFYGLSPLSVLAGRVDTDIWSRKFTEAFFRNAGVPAGLLNIQKTMSPQEREDTRRRFRELYGGEQGWHKLLVLDTGPNQVATYTQMGMPLGSNGAAMPELNKINEARILGVFGIPLGLIPTLAGSDANRGQTAAAQEQRNFWQQTMVPLFRGLDSTLSMGLADEFPDVDRFEHDLAEVQALQEDQNQLAERWTAVWKGGGITAAEYRQQIGLPEEPDKPGVVMLLNVSVPTPSDALFKPEEAVLEPPVGSSPSSTPPPQQPTGAASPPAPAAAGSAPGSNGVAH